MARKQLNFSVDPIAFANFEQVAKAEHMSAADFARLIVSKFGDIKQGFGLSALTAIPKEHFKLRPGRPASGSSFSAGNSPEVTA